jgi:RimJ/RimL family protein N-acetyltransferase
MNKNIKLIKLNSEHFEYLYDWYISELNFEYYTCRPLEKTKLSYEEFCEKTKIRLESKKTEEFIIYDEESNEFLGNLKSFDINTRNFSTEIGFYLSKDARGKKVGRFALKLFVDYLFKNRDYNKLYATTSSSNFPSMKILEYNNFTLDGQNREHYWIKGEKYDQLVYSILRSEWKI